MNAAHAAQMAEDAAAEQARVDAELAKQQAAIDRADAAAQKKARAEEERLLRRTQSPRSPGRSQKSPIEQVLGSRATQTILSGVIRGIFGNGRR